MPKMKTHSGAKKRFARTASGKFKMRHTFRRHLLTKRSQKRTRQLRKTGYVNDAHHHQIAVLLPYAD
jgi:large subunit ribosomal protein L35